MNRKGQTLVEFILILPLFIIILFIIVDFGMIASKKNELDNESVDIAMMVKNGKGIEEIRNLYPNLNIEINSDREYRKILISYDMDVITPGLNLILGDPYKIEIERVIANDEAE